MVNHWTITNHWLTTPKRPRPHGPCISAGTTTNSSPGVAHGALDKSVRTSPGIAMGAIHGVFAKFTCLGIMIIFNMVGKCWNIKQKWNMLKRIEASNQNVFGPGLDCFAWSCSKYLGTPAVAWHRSWPQIEMRPVAAFTEPDWAGNPKLSIKTSSW